MFKNVYSLYSAFYPSLHFTLSLHFTPGPQSAVCSSQSAFYTDRNTDTRILAGVCMHLQD